MNDYNSLYKLWLEKATESDLLDELKSIEGDDEAILDRFFQSLTFGTAGLRGVIGAGTNRMNVYTVAQATQGLANYLNEAFENPSCAIAYDSRIKSDVFSKCAAEVLAANGVKVYIYPELVPTPMLSFAVRKLKCSSGIILTASHNPSKYNGYKCYDPLGYRMTDEAAEKTYNYIQKIDMFADVKKVDFDKALESGMIEYIGQDVFESFYAEVEKACLSKEITKESGLKLIYTPLNGTGNKPVRHMLKKIGINDLTVVPEQELPDGNFPTCPFPNPEIKRVFELAIELGKKNGADLLLATDPDCDRVGIAVKDGDDYKLMSGNEVGVLLANYLLSRRIELGTLPKNPIVVKSFVTTKLVDLVSAKYGAQTASLLTGFKYIGELVTKLEENGEADRFICGMEESYGYLSGIHARDKDAVVASALICEMAAYYKTKGKSLLDVMSDIYNEFGIFKNVLGNYGFEGASGMRKMAEIMETLRNNSPKEIGGLKVVAISDYKTSIKTNVETGETEAITLPKSNVLAFDLENSNGVIVRPSGTEPKIKFYYTAVAKTNAEADKIVDALTATMETYVK